MTDYPGAENYAFDLLKTLSPEIYFFHNLEHTVGVRDAAIVLAGGEKVSEEEQELILKPAAVYHDIGFIEKYNSHEEVSVRIASEFLPQFGYPAEVVKRIGKVIVATGHRRPMNLLEEIICDADMDNLGRDNFYQKTDLLRRELSAFNSQKISIEEWLRKVFPLLKTHTYFTETAKKLWGEKKEENYLRIRKVLNLNPGEIRLWFKTL